MSIDARTLDKSQRRKTSSSDRETQQVFVRQSGLPGSDCDRCSNAVLIALQGFPLKLYKNTYYKYINRVPQYVCIHKSFFVIFKLWKFHISFEFVKNILFIAKNQNITDDFYNAKKIKLIFCFVYWNIFYFLFFIFTTSISIAISVWRVFRRGVNNIVIMNWFWRGG